MFKKESSFIVNFGMISILLFLLFYILYIWASLIIPFIVALLFSFALIWLSNFFKKFKIPGFIAFILSLASYSAIFYFIWRLIWSNIDELIKLLPSYQEQVLKIVWDTLRWLNIPEPTSVTEILNQINLQYFFTRMVWWFTSIFSSAGLILFYVLFILLEHRYFRDKIHLMIWNSQQKFHILAILEKIKKDVKSYFVIKTFVSLFTAVLSYLIMMAFGLDFAVFWALLIFILNFIPSIWSIIAVMFPSLLSLVQPEFTLYDGAFMISWLIWVQILMWNIIEPKFMWNKLNLSPLVIILSLWFWGSLWWVVGMLLSVPIMVIINIILSKIPITRPLAILLSEKWELQVTWWEEAIKNRQLLVENIKEKLKKKKDKKSKK